MKALAQAQINAAALIAVLGEIPDGTARNVDARRELGLTPAAMSFALGIAVHRGYVSQDLDGTIRLTEFGRVTLAEGRAKIAADGDE